MKKGVILTLAIVSFSYGISLDTLIQTAKKYNPVLNEKVLELKAQYHVVKQRRATRFGEIDIYGAYNRYEDPRILYPLSPPINPKNIIGAENQFIAGISYSVPIFTGFKITKSIKISELGKTLKQSQLNLTKNQIIYNLKVLYIKVLSLEKQLFAFKEYKKSLDVLYKNVKDAVKEGKKAEVDLLKVDYERKNVEATIDKIKNSINTLKSAIKTIVGKRDIDLSKLEDIKPETFPQKDLALAKINTLDRIKQVKTFKEIAKNKVDIAKSEYFPHVFLKAYTQRNIGNSEYKDLWQISVNIKYNLFDFGKRKHSYIEKALKEKIAKLKEKQVKLELLKDIDKAYNDIKTAQSKIKATEKQVQLAHTVEDIEKTKYEEGVSDIYDYLHAKAQRYLAESSYYQALYNKEIAISYLKYLLEEYKDE